MGYLKGFTITGKQIGKPKVTTQYPEQKRPKPERLHGRHVLNRYEDGMEKCIGCELCAGVCPARCIYVRGADNPPDEPVSPGERYGFVYEINFLRCIHCDLCVEACPTEAITESKLFEFSFTDRRDAIYTKAELLVDDDGLPRQLPWEDWKEGDDLNTSGWVRATAPSGQAAFEGRVLWSGELGYGVRPPQLGQSDPDSADYPADWDISIRETGAGAVSGVGVSSERPVRPVRRVGADRAGGASGAEPDDPASRRPAPVSHRPEAHGGHQVDSVDSVDTLDTAGDDH
jgi:NADH-quinone oxidoreductase subunit I